MDTKRTLETLKKMYTSSKHGYSVTDTIKNGYKAAILDVIALIEGSYPSILNGVAYLDMDEVETEFTKNHEFDIYVQRLKSLKDLLNKSELDALISYWWTDCQISEEAEDALFDYVRNVLKKERVDNMRKWVEQLDKIDIDCIEVYEELLGRQLTGYEEYVEIDKQVDCMVLDYIDCMDDFFKDYPHLLRYRKD